MSRRHKNRRFSTNNKALPEKTAGTPSETKVPEKPVQTNKRMGVTLSLRRNELHIYVGTLEALNNPDYIRLLVNKKRKRIAVQVCDEIDRDNYHVPAEDEEGRRTFNIASLKFLGMIYKMAGWDTEKSYRILGYLIGDYDLVLFCLGEAEEITEEEFENAGG